MTVEVNTFVDSLQFGGELRVAHGEILLVAGVGVQPLAGYSIRATPLVSREVPGGVIGDLSIAYNVATDELTVTSANAGDTSLVRFVIVE
jgi:hypothetical protein